MLTYITAFIFYTLAMVGILLLGFVVYKKAIMPSKVEAKGLIKIIDRTSISPKKSLLVVKVKNEKFLIAMDAERTTFLAKLADDVKQTKEVKEEKALQNMQPQISIQQKQPYIADIQQQRLDKIQKQFKQLYSSNQDEIRQDNNAMDRKEMIRKLLKELNDTTGAVKTGSY